MTTTELVRQDDVSPTMLMMTAIEKGLDLDKVEKALALQAVWEQNEARKAYHLAMSEFKKNPPQIEKDRHVRYQSSKGITEYAHASLANVSDKINSALSEHGLSASWETKQDNNKITVTCKITHSRGHSESTSLTASPDETGSKNPIQAIGSAISYLQRYTILALTGLATSDMDDDGGNLKDPEPITDKHLSTLRDMLADKEADEGRFCTFLKVESLETMPDSMFAQAFQAIKAKKKVTKNDNP